MLLSFFCPSLYPVLNIKSGKKQKQKSNTTECPNSLNYILMTQVKGTLLIWGCFGKRSHFFRKGNEDLFLLKTCRTVN